MARVFVPEDIAAAQALGMMYENGAGPANGAAPIFDGAIHRYDVEGEPRGKKSGAYLFRMNDGPGDDRAPGGWVQNHKLHSEPVNWYFRFKDGPAWLYQEWLKSNGKTVSRDDTRPVHSNPGLPPETPEEKAARIARIREQEREREKAEQAAKLAAKYAKAAQLARNIYESKRRASADHSYHVHKKIFDVPDRVRLHNDGRLIVPLYDGFTSCGGQLASLQFIAGDGSKSFLTGGKAKGSFLAIGEEYLTMANQTEAEYEKFRAEWCKEFPGEPDPARAKFPVILICEGYATGVTVWDFLTWRNDIYDEDDPGAAIPVWDGPAVVVCAMNKGGLRPVAEYIREAFTEARIYICADNDWRNEINVGLETALDALDAGIIDGVINPPDDKHGTDWNDFYSAYGLNKAAVVFFRRFPAASKTIGDEKY